MSLPPGRKPLTDKDMIILLHDIARQFGQRDQRMHDDLRQTADRLDELVSKAETRKHWTGHE